MRSVLGVFVVFFLFLFASVSCLLSCFCFLWGRGGGGGSQGNMGCFPKGKPDMTDWLYPA